MSRRYTVAVTIVLLTLAGAYLWCFALDTSTNRSLTADSIQSLVAAAKDDPTNTEVVDELLGKANSDWNFEAAYATASLGDLGQAASPRIGQIAKLMRSGNPYVRREAARSLSRLGVLSAPVLDELKRKVETDNPSDDETWFAVLAIGNIGEPAVECLPLLRSKLGTGATQYDDALKEAISKLENTRREDGGSDGQKE